MDHEKVLGEHKFPTYEELKTGLIRLIDEGKISREDAARLIPELRESEDERIRKAVVSLVYEMKGTYQSFAKVELDKMVAYLEKQKEQKPAEWEDYKDKVNIPYCSSEPEWSEEDERIMESLISLIETIGEYYISLETIDRYVAWLKTLRPRPSWKPSQEQMNCLCAAVDAAIRKHNESVSGYKPARVLKSLYEQLKKL